MRLRLHFLIVLIGLLAATHAQTSGNSSAGHIDAAHVPAPQEIVGFVPGDDRKLASWSQVVEYFRALAKASDRVEVETIGASTMGRPFILATISSAENLAHLDELKNIQSQLADPRKLGPPATRDRKATELIKRGKNIVLITCGIHSTEVGSYLSSMLIAHRLASSNDPNVQRVLRNTIILLVPSLNPDGVDIVKNWYDKTLGTPYEGTEPPELYHKFTGHDNNRDWYAFTQVETQVVVDKIHNVWHPQIVHDIHQQEENGSRLFLPPYMAPVEPNVPRQIVEGYTELGHYIAREMRAAKFTGITTDSTYDAWSPSRAYSHYHAGVRILSETASCNIATPLTVKFSDLKKGIGYDPKKESPTFGPLWHGGEWHLRDITSYMTTAAFLLLDHAATNREAWLRRFYQMGKEAVRPRKNGELFALIIPESRHRPDLLEVLNRAGVEYYVPLAFSAGRTKYPAGTVVIRMDQPYGGFAKALLEAQHYPDLRDEKGQPQTPYDVTAHSLAMLMGVDVQPIYQPFSYRLPRAEGMNSCTGFGEADEKVALYKSHVPAMDEGWTRWVLTHEHYKFSSIEDKDIRAGNLREKFDAIILPDQLPRTTLEGYKSGKMPPDITGGIGSEGVNALRAFVEDGGTLVCLNRASRFAIEQFKLPVRDVVANLSDKEFFVPGSILRVELDKTNPLTGDMPAQSIAWAENSPVFEVEARALESGAARVVASYPSDRNPLLSGWLLGEQRIRGKAALVEVKLGQGRIILFGFRPQYRGQSLATFPLFFNAITRQTR